MAGMFRVVPFAFSVEKSTPAGKKYASGASGASDKSQVCHIVLNMNLYGGTLVKGKQ